MLRNTARLGSCTPFHAVTLAVPPDANYRSARIALDSHEGDDAMHATGYLVYALLQMARDKDASRIVAGAASLTDTTPIRTAAPYSSVAMSAWYAVERGAWKEAAALLPTDSCFPFTAALTHFARRLGAARSDEPDAVDQEAQVLAKIRDSLRAAKNEYWAAEVEVNRLGVVAWSGLTRGKREKTLMLMRAAHHGH